MLTWSTLLLLIALVLFLIVAFGGFFPQVASRLQGRVNLMALGLALWVLAVLIGVWP